MKRPAPRKLRLAAETVRQLRAGELEVPGGRVAPQIQSDYTECIKSCSNLT